VRSTVPVSGGRSPLALGKIGKNPMKTTSILLASLIAAISALPAQDITPVQPEAIQK
jgi:hypothetical protein